jgi:hypothetical protein
MLVWEVLRRVLELRVVLLFRLLELVLSTEVYYWLPPDLLVYILLLFFAIITSFTLFSVSYIYYTPYSSSRKLSRKFL